MQLNILFDCIIENRNTKIGKKTDRMKPSGKKEVCLLLVGIFSVTASVAALITYEASNNIANSNMQTVIVENNAKDLKPTIDPLPEHDTLSAIEEYEDIATPTPAAALTISNYSVLKPNDEYPEVETLQLRLMELGYLESDEPGSAYNYAVQTAVETFQRALGIEPTGIADSNTQEKLFEPDALHYEVKIGSSGTDIRSMQKMLNTLGYYDGKITGYFGASTEASLMSFQAKNGLAKDGRYNNEDRELLYSDNALPYIELTPTPKPTNTPAPEQTSKPQKTKKPSASNESKPTATPKATGNDSGTGKVYPTGGSFHASGNVSGVISVAEAQIGKQYVTGDEGPDTFDCSGLVYYCLKMNGVGIGRRSAQSYSTNESWKLIKNMNDVQKGDLLFFTDPKHVGKVTHVGIYIGGGKMIDASSSRGEVVKRSSTSEYWETNFVCARRVF